MRFLLRKRLSFTAQRSTSVLALPSVLAAPQMIRGPSKARLRSEALLRRRDDLLGGAFSHTTNNLANSWDTEYLHYVRCRFLLLMQTTDYREQVLAPVGIGYVV